MTFFPIKEIEFKLRDDQLTTLDRLKRRTEYSENLTSQFTDKSFRGIIKGNEFKVISSTIGSGALCVMKGEICSEKGNVTVEIHKVFRVLFSIMLLLPFPALLAPLISETIEFSFIQIVILIGQFLMIRFVFIGLAFKFLSQRSLNRLRDVLDIEWI